MQNPRGEASFSYRASQRVYESRVRTGLVTQSQRIAIEDRHDNDNQDQTIGDPTRQYHDTPAVSRARLFPNHRRGPKPGTKRAPSSFRTKPSASQFQVRAEIE